MFLWNILKENLINSFSSILPQKAHKAGTCPIRKEALTYLQFYELAHYFQERIGKERALVHNQG
jgi:hypothetical protein